MRRVERRPGHPVGDRDDRRGRLEQREERARLVEHLLELLVQRARAASSTVVAASCATVSISGPRPRPSRRAGRRRTRAEHEVVLRIRVVRVPQPQAHLLVARPVVLQRRGDRSRAELDGDADLLEVGGDALGDRPERQPVDGEVARVLELQGLALAARTWRAPPAPVRGRAGPRGPATASRGSASGSPQEPARSPRRRARRCRRSRGRSAPLRRSPGWTSPRRPPGSHWRTGSRSSARRSRRWSGPRRRAAVRAGRWRGP